jgi:hypothetical protein
VKRVLHPALGAVVALVFLTAAASPTPSAAPSTSPSPSVPAILATILAPAAGAGWVEQAKNTPNAFEGPFTAKQYVGLGNSSNAATAQSTLEHDGFVAGYGRTWVNNTAGRALVEAVIAFSGGAGAKSWLAASQVADKADPSYKGPLTITGISSYYGVKLFDPQAKIYADAFAFVKGNDFFVVGTDSTVDDKGAAATTQATAQYQMAPDNTIPPSKWPAVTTPSSTLNAGRLAGEVFVVALVAFAAIFIIRLLRRGRRRQAMASQTAVDAGHTGQTAPAGIVQLSQDGNFWWDGQSWRNANHEVPPTAQRSTDGGFWWDGATWRPMPPHPT